jgi:hypothetical protein
MRTARIIHVRNDGQMPISDSVRFRDLLSMGVS